MESIKKETGDAWLVAPGGNSYGSGGHHTEYLSPDDKNPTKKFANAGYGAGGAGAANDRSGTDE